MNKPESILPQVLSELDKAALIELIIRQGGQLQELWQQNEGLQQQNEGLQQQIEELEKATKRPVAPFRIADKDRKGHKKRSGAPKGHQGHYRKVSGQIDEHIEVNLQACAHCQGPVCELKPLRQVELKPLRQVIEELVVRPWRMSLTTYEGHCQLRATASIAAGCVPLMLVKPLPPAAVPAVNSVSRRLLQP